MRVATLTASDTRDTISLTFLLVALVIPRLPSPRSTLFALYACCSTYYSTMLLLSFYFFYDLHSTNIVKLQAHVGKQPIARWYFPPEVDYRLEALPPDAKGLVVWIIEAKVIIYTNTQKEKKNLIFFSFIKTVTLVLCIGSLQVGAAVSCFASHPPA